ncbi:hypothetical protein EYR40_006420 [Pleurotus pulmonarius]|nr:hypothetical protein EYR40_006420 [Pleurotus pulmonarius]
MMSLLNPPRLPPKDARQAVNPVKAMRALTWTQQAIFWSGWFAPGTVQPEHACDDHSDYTDAPPATGGAFIVGLLADRFGRKWPLVGVLLVIAGPQIITSFMTTFSRFLAVRSLYGIAMGGVWGVAGAASLESMPVASRGIYSGLIQGASVIFVLVCLIRTNCELKLHLLVRMLVATVVNLLLVPNTPQTWRSIFWFGAGLSLLAAGTRASLPEGDVFNRSKAVARRENLTAVDKAVVFTHSLRRMFKDHWALWVYGVVFIGGLQFLAHSSQDLYTAFLQASKGFSASLANEANIIGEAGALIGGALGGYLSQFLGRKVTIVFACIWSAAFIPLWILPSSWGRLSIGAFFLQVGINTAWGTIAIHLNELAPPAFRGVFTGTVNQTGNMASSASAQIIATAGITLRKQVSGVDQPDYGTIQAILAALSCAMVIICTFFGPERHSAPFEDGRTAIEEGVAHNDRTSSSSGEGQVEKTLLFGHLQCRVRMLSEQMMYNINFELTMAGKLPSVALTPDEALYFRQT